MDNNILRKDGLPDQRASGRPRKLPSHGLKPSECAALQYIINAEPTVFVELFQVDIADSIGYAPRTVGNVMVELENKGYVKRVIGYRLLKRESPC